jgi:transposase
VRPPQECADTPCIRSHQCRLSLSIRRDGPRRTLTKIRDVLRLKFDCGLPDRQIAKSVGIARSSVGEYVRRFQAAGLVWPLSSAPPDPELEACLFPAPVVVLRQRRPLPDWATVHQELRRKGVTLLLLWQEYKAAHPEGLQYSRFCDLYQVWRGQRDLVMRQMHRAGEKLFVDFCGQTVAVTDRETGEIRPAQIFVAVLGASNHTYAEAVASQGLADWIGAHTRAFQFFGGVPEVLVPDNLASAVTKACRYEPDLNASYAEMAAHYGVAVVPARERKPRDKAKVEAGVLLVERWVLARLRHQVFGSLTALNQAIRELVEALNRRPFKKLPGCRLEAFESLDRPALKPLPAVPYEFAHWKQAKVHVDYHVEVDGHYYSVPHALVGRKVDRKRSFNDVWNGGGKEVRMVSTYKQVDTYDREKLSVVAAAGHGTQAGWAALLRPGSETGVDRSLPAARGIGGADGAGAWHQCQLVAQVDR